MRKYIYNVLSFVLLISVFSCSDDNFEKTTTSQISDKDLQDAIQKNADLAKGLVSGMYTTTITSSMSDAATNRNDQDFGQKAVDITSDIMSGDMAVTSNDYGWFYKEEQLKAARVNDGRNEVIWTFYYKLIKSANDVLAAYESDVEIPNEAAYVWAQAKTMRAYAYYNLVNLYAKGYEGHEGDKSVIIYHAKDDVAKSLSTVKEVYEFITKDLEQAIEIMSNEPNGTSTKSEINYSVTSGLLAYVYLATGKYQEAYNAADKALNEGSYSVMTATEVVGGFNSVNNPSWMWGIEITKDNASGLNSWWGMCDYFTYSYVFAGMLKVMDSNLYAQIKNNDIRKYQFDKELKPIWKFYNEARKPGQKKWESDVIFMRASEMLLIKAEANARQGKDASSEINSLLELRKAEDVEVDGLKIPDNATGTPAYGSTLQDIYIQWRIELWGEGQGLFTMKRFKETIKRGSNHGEMKGISISYDDDRLTFPIPDVETNDNPNIN